MRVLLEEKFNVLLGLLILEEKCRAGSFRASTGFHGSAVHRASSCPSAHEHPSCLNGTWPY